MAEKFWNPKKKTGGSDISKTEWGMVISVLAIVDVIQIVFDLLFQIGVIINRFIDIAVGMAWTTYLKLRGVNLDTKFLSILATFFFEEIPDVDALPLWSADGFLMYALVKNEKKIDAALKVGAAAAAVALAPETGGTSLAAGEAAEGAVVAEEAGATAEGAAGAKDGEEALAGAEGPEAAEGKEGVEGEKETGKEKKEGEEEGTERRKKEVEGKDEEKESGRERASPESADEKRRRGGAKSPHQIDLRGRDEERKREKETTREKSNLLDLSLSYGERKKQSEEDDE